MRRLSFTFAAFILIACGRTGVLVDPSPALGQGQQVVYDFTYFYANRANVDLRGVQFTDHPPQVPGFGSGALVPAAGWSYCPQSDPPVISYNAAYVDASLSDPARGEHYLRALAAHEVCHVKNGDTHSPCKVGDDKEVAANVCATTLLSQP